MIILRAYSGKKKWEIVYVFRFMLLLFLPVFLSLNSVRCTSLHFPFFNLPPGLRSQVRFARCPAATCSSRAAVSVTGTVHDNSLTDDREGEDTAENPQLEVERGVPRRRGLLAFCAVTSEHFCPEDRTETSRDREHRGENRGGWSHETLSPCMCDKLEVFPRYCPILKWS